MSTNRPHGEASVHGPPGKEVIPVDFDAIQEWFQELLIDGIISNLTGMFDTLNTKVGEIAGEVGMTPAAWNSGIFNMIRSLSETVIVPIAGIVLTFVMCYELIQLIVEKNNLHDDVC